VLFGCGLFAPNNLAHLKFFFFIIASHLIPETYFLQCVILGCCFFFAGTVINYFEYSSHYFALPCMYIFSCFWHKAFLLIVVISFSFNYFLHCIHSVVLAAILTSAYSSYFCRTYVCLIRPVYFGASLVV
jgi:hypothetical protein